MNLVLGSKKMRKIRSNKTQHNSEIAIEAFNQLFPTKKINMKQIISEKNKDQS